MLSEFQRVSDVSGLTKEFGAAQSVALQIGPESGVSPFAGFLNPGQSADPVLSQSGPVVGGFDM